MFEHDQHDSERRRLGRIRTSSPQMDQRAQTSFSLIREYHKFSAYKQGVTLKTENIRLFYIKFINKFANDGLLDIQKIH